MTAGLCIVHDNVGDALGGSRPCRERRMGSPKWGSCSLAALFRASCAIIPPSTGREHGIRLDHQWFGVRGHAKNPNPDTASVIRLTPTAQGTIRRRDENDNAIEDSSQVDHRGSRRAGRNGACWLGVGASDGAERRPAHVYTGDRDRQPIERTGRDLRAGCQRFRDLRAALGTRRCSSRAPSSRRSPAAISKCRSRRRRSWRP